MSAIVKCGKCSDIIESNRDGLFIVCSCKASFVDIVCAKLNIYRYGGAVLPLTKSELKRYRIQKGDTMAAKKTTSCKGHGKEEMGEMKGKKPMIAITIKPVKKGKK